MKQEAERGFTLIEITIALLVLAIGLVGILSLFPVGFDAAGRSMHTTTATMLAQRLIEDCKVQGYDEVNKDQTGYGHGYGMDTGGDEVVFEAPYNAYSYEIDVTPQTPPPDLKKITVTVHRPDGRDTTLTTYMAKHEP